MDLEQRLQLEQEAAIADSIALEALNSTPATSGFPGLQLDDKGAAIGPRQVHSDDLPGQGSEGGADGGEAGGEPIDVYCDRNQLDVRRRIELFIRVCHVVHSAHQRAVIHRDLKPDNILVTPDGVPRLVGFGDARVVRGGAADAMKTVASTGVAQTPEDLLPAEYASPEQITGEAVTTASDVYALGVILYKLMTGRRPYHFKTRNVPEVLQAICEQAPERPSAAVVRPVDQRAIPLQLLPEVILPQPELAIGSAPGMPGDAPSLTSEAIAATRGCSARRLKQMLHGDLDAIILTAMRKEPERRYASAAQFVVDLSRYLTGLPVAAQGDSEIYRAVKFVRRHSAAAVITSVVLAAILIAGTAVITTGLITARRQRDRADRSFNQALETVDEFFNQVNEERILNQPGLDPVRKALLEHAQRFYEDFVAQRGGDRSLRAELATACSNLAQISASVGSTTKAVEEFEQAVTRWDSLVASEPAVAAYREALARTLGKQGNLMMGIPDRRGEAERISRRAARLFEPLVAVSGSATTAHELSLVLLQIAELEHERGEEKQAIENIQRSLMIESGLAANDPGALDPAISMAKGHALLGRVFANQPEGTGQALEAYGQTIELLGKVNREHPEFSDQEYELALYLGDLSGLEQRAGKLDSALASARKGVEYLERLKLKHPSVLRYLHSLAGGYRLMSDLHRYRREPADAITFAQKAKAVLERLVALQPGDTSSRIDLAKTHNVLGRLFQQTGEPQEALRCFQLAVDRYESLPVLDAHNAYGLAANVALSIPLIGAKNGSVGEVEISKLSKGDQLRRKRYGDRAVELVREAAVGGFPSFDVLRSDPDLDPIRDRLDFQKVLDDVEKKSAGQSNQD